MNARMKLDKFFDYDVNAEGYMQAFRPDVYRAYRNDEFQFRRKKQETVEMMKAAAEKSPLEAVLTLKAGLRFGSYDFTPSNIPLTATYGSRTSVMYTHSEG